MHALHLLSVWLHLLAAITWIGGMFFLVLVVVPWMRRGNRASGAQLLRETGTRFRTIAWVCFGVLVVTGTFQLWARGVRLGDLASAEWLGSSFGATLALKLATFALVVAVSLAHDFVLGPRAARALEEDPSAPSTERIRRRTSMLGRANVLLALVLVACGVILVRGWPF